MRENLLDIMLNPDNRMKSATDICKLAQISRSAYYKAVNNEEFQKRYREESKTLVACAVGPVINAFILQAQRGSFPHGKILLEMAGMYVEPKDMTLRNPPGEAFRVDGLKDMSTEALLKLAGVE